MKATYAAAGWLVLVFVLPMAVLGSHRDGCVPEAADPATYNEVDLGFTKYYIEERENPLGTSPPVPGSGLLLGGGTWIYEETNALAGLQRGGIALSSTCTVFPPPGPCILIDKDPIEDENCGHGRDRLIF